LERGKEELAKLLRRQDLPMRRLLTHETLATVASDLNLQSVDALYTSIGQGHTGAQHVVEKLRAVFGGSEGAEEDVAEMTLASRVRPPRRGPGDGHAAGADRAVFVAGKADWGVRLSSAARPAPVAPLAASFPPGPGTPAPPPPAPMPSSFVSSRPTGSWMSH